MARRRHLSISFSGLPYKDDERLRENNLEFYGSDSSDSDSGTDDEGLDVPPPTKRPHVSSID